MECLRAFAVFVSFAMAILLGYLPVCLHNNFVCGQFMLSFPLFAIIYFTFSTVFVPHRPILLFITQETEPCAANKTAALFIKHTNCHRKSVKLCGRHGKKATPTKTTRRRLEFICSSYSGALESFKASTSLYIALWAALNDLQSVWRLFAQITHYKRSTQPMQAM